MKWNYLQSWSIKVPDEYQIPMTKICKFPKTLLLSDVIFLSLLLTCSSYFHLGDDWNTNGCCLYHLPVRMFKHYRYDATVIIFNLFMEIDYFVVDPMKTLPFR